MASSGSVFSKTLQTITTTKLEVLAEQRDAFEKQYAELLDAASKEHDLLKRVSILAAGTKTCLDIVTAPPKPKNTGRVVVGATNNSRLETDLKNLDRFLEQTRYDPSVSLKVLENWETMLHQYLSVQSAKFQYGQLYGRLVMEWLSSETGAPSDEDVEMTESFEEVPGTKRLEARDEWEKVVFEPKQVDVDLLKEYLRTLFIADDDKSAGAIRDLRRSVQQFEITLKTPKQFSNENLRWTIEGLQSSDLLPNEKREALKDFLSNDVILGEIGDVLNMRMAALSRWTWGEYVPLEQRRRVNGNFTIHLDEDLLQAIFLHYIGVKWCVFFKEALTTFYNVAWKSSHAVVPRVDRLRRQYYLGMHMTKTNGNIVDARTAKHRAKYFAYQLVEHHKQKVEMEEGEEEAQHGESEDGSRKRERAKQTARRSVPGAQSYQRVAPRAVSEGNDNEGHIPAPKRPMQAKQDLLHMLASEIILNTRLYGEVTCFRSVFESWNPLLPHDTILTVLEFFGVSDDWRAFFKKFLEAPLKFTDDGSATPRFRRRGTPGSHALSDVFGEMVLACLDFSVNKATNGGLLHRLSDDIWFWSKDYEKCAQAWASVLQFTKVMNVELSGSKTGTVRVSGEKGKQLPIDNRLPTGEIRWGFLYLDSASGKFQIDGKMVDTHIKELRTQLQGKSKSVIGWIQAWNTYATTFFSSNFGKPANCFGRDHVDNMLATHRRVQESIFNGGNVVDFLRKAIEERFGVKDIPDGFLFFPVELGGLQVQSPFVNLLQIRESVEKDPYNLVEDFEEHERNLYDAMKRNFDADGPCSVRRTEDPHFTDVDPNTFFPFSEFVRWREEFGPQARVDLSKVYTDLLKRPVEVSIDISVQVQQAINQLAGQSNLRGIVGDWSRMEAYWKWVAQLYGPEMVQRFGGLNVVDLGLLPIGMVSMLRQKRMKWEG